LCPSFLINVGAHILRLSRSACHKRQLDHRDQASWRNAGGFDRTIIDDPGLATAEATEKTGFSERKRCRWSSVDKLPRIFLLRQQKQPMIEIKPVYATLCWTKTGEQPRTVTERELHDHFHPELVHECILRKLPQIVPKLARRTVNHPVAEQFTGRNSVEKCRN
jgi:hypothetical protein